ncbi:hypothetical protein QBC37DRAFT_433919 [Rhypophila decipiens]|uniref:mRNA 3'-end-processing protein n=1 Tax=Rhypophila decipiens TaxID=261697 RepID=A0AAN6XV37_9PEZI|nr:hypothetical protein QBC37DRAFT_433919 [Rhypophila decipiens]
MASTMAPPSHGGQPHNNPNPLVASLLTRTTPNYTFSFTPFLQKTYQHSLPPDRPICKAYQNGQCPLRSHCTERHISAPPNPNSTSSRNEGGFGSLVCKHWLRGLCKKGESCEFLHEYNLRKMPECNFFVRNGYCSNGDECLYLHIDPQSKLPPCPHYDRGFCPLGPRCDKKHVRRKLCPFYMAGFCPDGARLCKEGTHAKWTRDADMEKPRVREEKKVEEEKDVGQQQGMYGHGHGRDRDGLMSERDREQRDTQASHDRGNNRGDRDRDERGHDGRGHKFERGGRGRGGWRGKGGRFRGRGGHDRGGH